MTFKPTFLDVQFGHKSPLLEALELIGPAYDDGSFSVRYGIASMIVQPILRSYENRAIRCDPTTGRADVREIDETLAQVLAGTEFTAKVTQPGAHQLVVNLTPNRFDTYKHDCDRCTPLGSWSDGQRIYDLYYCDKFKVGPTVIARYGSDGHEYTSGLGPRVPVLLKAEVSADKTGTIGVDLASGRDWTVKGIWELTEKLPGVTTAVPTQRWEGDTFQPPDAYFTSAEIAALTATPENLRASMAKHGHVIFVLCLDENEERQRLHREGVDTDRIRFLVMPKVPKCDICGDFALYLCRLPYEVPTTEPRCQRHLRDDPSEDYNPMKEPPCES